MSSSGDEPVRGWLKNLSRDDRRIMKKNRHIGSSCDDFLAEENLLAECEIQALKEVLALQIRQSMETEGLSKSAMARRMKTSRPALDRLLDPGNTSVTLHTLQRAAQAIGKRLHLELIGPN